ncbi:glycosyltransferase [Xinfangfangia pollutisoli]|uniref:glycosyltransferase n=1 Tax=Xinfangfangia pollutisoli TaxID=2865960 RepID=UPI001CD66BFD|nr:glycosyltransferase [Xinfangfangia pollutisoli]
MRDLTGQLIGYVEHIEYRDRRVRVAGWCLFDNLQLLTLSGRIPIRRGLHRGDVVAVLGKPAMFSTGNPHGRVAFDEEAEWCGGPVTLALQRDNTVLNWLLPVPSQKRIGDARRKLLLPFAGKVLKAFPKGCAYLLLGRPKHLRTALVHHFNLHPPLRVSHRFDVEIFQRGDDIAVTPAGDTPITIVLPVYNAFDLLPEVLARVEAHTDLPWHLILIEDCSSDARVRPWLQHWARGREERVTLIANDQNLGFVESVNHGLKRASRDSGHVVLLNSDAFVPQGWASRLIAPIASNPEIASVTPMSNDATIFSVPLIAGSCQIMPGAVDHIDAVAARLDPGSTHAVAPTGVGFCMALNREALRRVPQLDTTFGKGYGEEVDWCQRVAQTGMKNVGIGNLFVEHRGGQSFGQAHKLEAMRRAGQIVARRYPQYDAEVQEFIRLDPLWKARFVLALALAASRPEAPLHVYLAHSMGGGAQSWLGRRISEREADGYATAVIRIGGSDRFVVTLHVDGGSFTCTIEDPQHLRQLFGPVGTLHVVYSCGVGDPDPVSLPGLLCDLAAEEGSSLEVLFHDYLPISPSFNLLDSDATWRGVPNPASQDPAHSSARPDGRRVRLPEWRAAWSQLIRRADQLTVFSRSSKDIVAQCWPWAEGKIRLMPSRLPVNIPQVKPAIARAGQKVSLAVLGAIGEEKGARIVSKLSFALEGRSDGPNLVIIGEFDRRFPLAPSTVVTGRYDIRNLADIMHRHRVAVWLMPSICPETFSFTTHEMIATGLPVMSFNIGAQGEAVMAAPNGHIVPVDVDEIQKVYHQLQAVTEDLP